MAKVIIHYLDGTTHTHTGVMIWDIASCDWLHGLEIPLLVAEDVTKYRGFIQLKDKEIMAIESRLKGVTKIYTHPDKENSVQVSVMTARQRMKQNSLDANMWTYVKSGDSYYV